MNINTKSNIQNLPIAILPKYKQMSNCNDNHNNLNQHLNQNISSNAKLNKMPAFLPPSNVTKVIDLSNINSSNLLYYINQPINLPATFNQPKILQSPAHSISLHNSLNQLQFTPGKTNTALNMNQLWSTSTSKQPNTNRYPDILTMNRIARSTPSVAPKNFVLPQPTFTKSGTGVTYNPQNYNNSPVQQLNIYSSPSSCVTGVRSTSKFTADIASQNYQTPNCLSGNRYYHTTKHTPTGSSGGTPYNPPSGSGDRAGKGLRHFSMKVCEKVRRKGVTTYNEVADELVAEYALASFFNNAALSANSPRGAISDTETALTNLAYDHKNIRRRVYDALNVLMAMNIISKEKKEIRWIGLPTNPSQECANLAKEKAKRLERIREKQLELNKLLLKQIALKNVIELSKSKESNRRHNELRGIKQLVDPSNGRYLDGTDYKSFNKRSPYNCLETSLFLPFLLISTDKSTIIECSISNDKCEYYFNFNNDFEVIDDYQIMKKLNYTMGLDDTYTAITELNLKPIPQQSKIGDIKLDPSTQNDDKSVSENVLAKALTLVPKVMHPYLTQLAGYSKESRDKSAQKLADNNSSLFNNTPVSNILTSLDSNSKLLKLTSTSGQYNEATNNVSLNVNVSMSSQQFRNMHQTSHNTTNRASVLLNNGTTTMNDDTMKIDLLTKYNLVQQTYISTSSSSNAAAVVRLNFDNETHSNATKFLNVNNNFYNNSQGSENTMSGLLPSSPAVSLATLQFKNLLSNRAATLLLQQQKQQQQIQQTENNQVNVNGGVCGFGIDINKFDTPSTLAMKQRMGALNKMVPLSKVHNNRVLQAAMLQQQQQQDKNGTSSTSTSEIFSSEDSLGSSQSQNSSSATSFGYGGV